MALFGLFGKKGKVDERREIPWINLQNTGQLEEIESLSQKWPVLIFKHSTRCGISSMALRRFERDLDVDTDRVKLFYLDLLAYRELSDKVAARFQVWHQSPQIIVVDKGQTVHHASHHRVGPEILNELIN